MELSRPPSSPGTPRRRTKSYTSRYPKPLLSLRRVACSLALCALCRVLVSAQACTGQQAAAREAAVLRLIAAASRQRQGRVPARHLAGLSHHGELPNHRGALRCAAPAHQPSLTRHLSPCPAPAGHLHRTLLGDRDELRSEYAEAVVHLRAAKGERAAAAGAVSLAARGKAAATHEVCGVQAPHARCGGSLALPRAAKAIPAPVCQAMSRAPRCFVRALACALLSRFLALSTAASTRAQPVLVPSTLVDRHGLCHCCCAGELCSLRAGAPGACCRCS